MPRLVLTKAITYRDSKFHFTRGIAQDIDEDSYHRLLHSGKLHDPDKNFQSIDPPTVLPKLKPGTEVLLCREMGLGDVLMVTVVAKALAQKYPKLRFRFLTGSRYAPVVGKLPFLESVEPLIEVNGRHPYVIDLRGLSEKKSWGAHTLDRIDLYARYCGVKIQDYRIPIEPIDTQSAAHQRITKLFHDKQFPVAITLRGSTELRSWPMNHCRRFAELLLARGWTPVALDGKRFEMPEGCLNLSGELDLVEVKSALSRCEFNVAPDTGLVHLSEAVGTKCLALFTVIPPELRITHYRNVKAFVRRDLPCFPCHHRGCPQFFCGNGISPAQVLHALDHWDDLPQISNPAMGYADIPTAIS